MFDETRSAQTGTMHRRARLAACRGCGGRPTLSRALAGAQEAGLARRILSQPGLEGDPLEFLKVTEAYWAVSAMGLLVGCR